MEESTELNVSSKRSLSEINFPSGPSPVPHKTQFLDPRDVEAHFAALEIKPESAEVRWARKANASPFRGV